MSDGAVWRLINRAGFTCQMEANFLQNNQWTNLTTSNVTGGQNGVITIPYDGVVHESLQIRINYWTNPGMIQLISFPPDLWLRNGSNENFNWTSGAHIHAEGTTLDPKFIKTDPSPERQLYPYWDAGYAANWRFHVNGDAGWSYYMAADYKIDSPEAPFRAYQATKILNVGDTGQIDLPYAMNISDVVFRFYNAASGKEVCNYSLTSYDWTKGGKFKMEYVSSSKPNRIVLERDNGDIVICEA